jgi:hypothetical protein
MSSYVSFRMAPPGPSVRQRLYAGGALCYRQSHPFIPSNSCADGSAQKPPLPPRHRARSAVVLACAARLGDLHHAPADLARGHGGMSGAADTASGSYSQDRLLVQTLSRFPVRPRRRSRRAAAEASFNRPVGGLAGSRLALSDPAFANTQAPGPAVRPMGSADLPVLRPPELALPPAAEPRP